MGCVFIRQQVLQISIYGNRRFTQLFVPQASQSSYDRRAELDVRLAIPSAQSACGMEIFTKNGMAVSAMPFFVVKGASCGKAMYKRCKML